MYPTDLTDSQSKVMEKIINDQRKRKYPLRIILNAILYINKGGIQWRLLPKEFPSWQLVYYYFRKWLYNGLQEKIQIEQRELLREKQGQNACPSGDSLKIMRSIENQVWLGSIMFLFQ